MPDKKPGRVDAATNYAIGKIRELGRELTSGSWSVGSVAPTTVAQATAIIASALSHVVDTGHASAKESYQDIFEDKDRQELNFDGDDT